MVVVVHNKTRVGVGRGGVSYSGDVLVQPTALVGGTVTCKKVKVGLIKFRSGGGGRGRRLQLHLFLGEYEKSRV